VLADAGADYATYKDPQTGYDIVQTAADCGQFEAVVKLVEAGASWRLAAGKERASGGSLLYVTDMLNSKVPGLKVSKLPLTSLTEVTGAARTFACFRPSISKACAV
jgi:hypothetical protein